MRKSIVLYGGQFSPPTGLDVAVGRALRRRFGRTFVIPCGMRRDTRSTNAVDPMHRARMATIAFAPLRVDIDVSDLESGTFTPQHALDARFRTEFPDAEVWHAVSHEHVRGGAGGTSNIQRSWERGAEIWNALRFVVILDPDRPLDPRDLPPHATTISVRAEEEPPRLREYLRRFGLYFGGTGQRREGLLTLPTNPRICVIPNPRSAAATAKAEEIVGERVRLPGDADVVVAIGGDGHMLGVLKRMPLSVPVVGLNAGTVGFLLNNVTAADLSAMLRSGVPFETHVLPLLEVDVTRTDGSTVRAFGLNDAWIERSGMQTGWVSVDVSWPRFSRRIERLMCAAAIVANPVGSTAYAYNVGSPPLPLSSHSLALAAEGSRWNGAVLPEFATVTFTALDTAKRPMRAMVDGKYLGPCREIRIHRSRSRSVELGFLPGQSLTEKIADRQFKFEF